LHPQQHLALGIESASSSRPKGKGISRMPVVEDLVAVAGGWKSALCGLLDLRYSPFKARLPGFAVVLASSFQGYAGNVAAFCPFVSSWVQDEVKNPGPHFSKCRKAQNLNATQ
jgi:hypothetical protein